VIWVLGAMRVILPSWNWISERPLVSVRTWSFSWTWAPEVAGCALPERTTVVAWVRTMSWAGTETDAAACTTRK